MASWPPDLLEIYLTSLIYLISTFRLLERDLQTWAPCLEPLPEESIQSLDSLASTFTLSSLPSPPIRESASAPPPCILSPPDGANLMYQPCSAHPEYTVISTQYDPSLHHSIPYPWHNIPDPVQATPSPPSSFPPSGGTSLVSEETLLHDMETEKELTPEQVDDLGVKRAAWTDAKRKEVLNAHVPENLSALAEKVSIKFSSELKT